MRNLDTANLPAFDDLSTEAKMALRAYTYATIGNHLVYNARMAAILALRNCIPTLTYADLVDVGHAADWYAV